MPRKAEFLESSHVAGLWTYSRRYAFLRCLFLQYVRSESRVYWLGDWDWGLGIGDRGHGTSRWGKGWRGCGCDQVAITITIREQDYGTDKRAACIDEPHHSIIRPFDHLNDFPCGVFRTGMYVCTYRTYRTVHDPILGRGENWYRPCYLDIWRWTREALGWACFPKRLGSGLGATIQVRCLLAGVASSGRLDGATVEPVRRFDGSTVRSGRWDGEQFRHGQESLMQQADVARTMGRVQQTCTYSTV